MKVLHTSDWHLGRQFHNVPLLEDQIFVIDQMISYAIEQSIEVFIIAGDVFDRTVPPANAVAYFNDVLNRLHDANISVIAISGNHDGAERLGFGSSVLSKRGIHIITELSELYQPISITKDGYTVIFYPLAYVDPIYVKRFLENKKRDTAHQTQDLFASDPDTDPLTIVTHEDAYKALMQDLDLHKQESIYRVLIAHCFVDGAASSESERPLSIGTLETVDPKHFEGFDYVALGHLHGRQFKHRETIRYSGTPLKYSFSEVDHIKSFTLITIDQKALSFEQVPLTPLRNMRKMSGYFDQMLADGKVNPSDDYLYIELLDTHALLDVMTQLRQVYPNVLSVERSGLMANKEQVRIDKKSIKNKSESRLFEDFYQQMTGVPISDEQTQVLHGLLNDLHKDESS
jgi:exonuclease SbcD